MTDNEQMSSEQFRLWINHQSLNIAIQSIHQIKHTVPPDIQQQTEKLTNILFANCNNLFLRKNINDES